MKIISLRVSNLLSFRHYPDIDDAPEIKFDDNLNILIGQNGSGKSTVLEIINFVLKNVLFTRFDFNYDIYRQRTTIVEADRKRVVLSVANGQYGSFRLDPNWNTPNETQKIKIQVGLDQVDKSNLQNLGQNKEKLSEVATSYTQNPQFIKFDQVSDVYTFEITLTPSSKAFQVVAVPDDSGYNYLRNYHYFKELINLYNTENPSDPIPPLYESFVLIGGYRNYNAFEPFVSLQNDAAPKQLQNLRHEDYLRSANSSEQTEPPIFRWVRLRIAGLHYNLFGDSETAARAEEIANDEPFLKKVNEKLVLVNLQVKIKLLDKQNWSYLIELIDTKRATSITSINSLSAGQKSIIHLIFEAYGRGGLEGGVMIIDEPEIHLHYQFQHEYLKIVRELMAEQQSQYIIVTHSESLINSSTVNHIKRLSLDGSGNSWVADPVITADDKTLIKILDNTKSTYAFFARKVLLVEGDSDRYFFKAILQQLHPDMDQQVAVLDIGGKGNFENWRNFFRGFGMEVHYIGDFDNVYSVKFSGTPIIAGTVKQSCERMLRQNKLNSLTLQEQQEFKAFFDAATAAADSLQRPVYERWEPMISKFRNLSGVTQQAVSDEIRNTNPGIEAAIAAKYAEKIYILKKGALEKYTNRRHGDLNDIVVFCETGLTGWLAQTTDEVAEIKDIFNRITA